MVKTWRPTVGGILSIIAGGISLILGILIILALIIFYATSYYSGATYSLFAVVVGVTAFYFLITIMAIIGGIYALKRDRWGIALAGSICAAVTLWAWIIGIASVILIAISKDEFDQPVSPPPGPPINEDSQARWPPGT